MTVRVQGYCPRGCGPTLIVGDGGYLRCLSPDCDQPDAISRIICSRTIEQPLAHLDASLIHDFTFTAAGDE